MAVEIEDDGPGIPSDVQERMFQPFYSTKSQGTGLGLPLAQQVAAEHGGAVVCRSCVGEGTVFRVTLPRPAPLIMRGGNAPRTAGRETR